MIDYVYLCLSEPSHNFYWIVLALSSRDLWTFVYVGRAHYTVFVAPLHETRRTYPFILIELS